MKTPKSMLTALILIVLSIGINLFIIRGSTSVITNENWDVININGNLSLHDNEDIRNWNFHSFGFDEEVEWKVELRDEASVNLKTDWGDAGHISIGMWWTNSFRQGIKIPIHKTTMKADFDINLEQFDYVGNGEWLRVALACAVQRGDGSVIYTEMDLRDSPNTQKHTRGDIERGGDTIYQGGDVVEFKIDEIPMRTWKHYSIELTHYIDRAWTMREGDRLESVYIVIESENNPVEVRLRLDNLWIYQLEL